MNDPISRLSRLLTKVKDRKPVKRQAFSFSGRRDLVRLLEDCINDVRDGTIPTKVATALASIASVMIRSYELSELEEVQRELALLKEQASKIKEERLRGRQPPLRLPGGLKELEQGGEEVE